MRRSLSQRQKATTPSRTRLASKARATRSIMMSMRTCNKFKVCSLESHLIWASKRAGRTWRPKSAYSMEFTPKTSHQWDPQPRINRLLLRIWTFSPRAVNLCRRPSHHWLILIHFWSLQLLSFHQPSQQTINLNMHQSHLWSTLLHLCSPLLLSWHPLLPRADNLMMYRSHHWDILINLWSVITLSRN